MELRLGDAESMEKLSSSLHRNISRQVGPSSADKLIGCLVVAITDQPRHTSALSCHIGCHIGRLTRRTWPVLFFLVRS